MTAIDNKRFLDWITKCNRYSIDEFIPFVVEQQAIGYIHQDNLDMIRSFSDSLQIKNDHLCFTGPIKSFAQKSSSMNQIVASLHQQGVIKTLVGEQYDVMSSFNSEILFTMERAGTTLFGVHKYGIHLNAYVLKNNHYYMWVATRAKDKPTWPGKLDHLVAGGHGSGYSIEQTMIKECEEEAAIPANLARQALPVSLVNYVMQMDNKLSRDTLFVYDLLLPHDFIPQNTDGEVASFDLLPIEEVLDIVNNTDHYKTNCNLVIIDFAIRHGFIKPDQAYYDVIAKGLRNSDKLTKLK